MSEGIKLTASQIQTLFDNIEKYGDGSAEGAEVVEGFEGWGIYADYETGDFDSGKSAMIDFEIELFDEKGTLRGTAKGGYYHQGDYSFNYENEFTLSNDGDEEDYEINFSEREIISEMIEFINDMPTMMEPIQERMQIDEEDFNEILSGLKQKL